jgi:hypothetical protein
MHIWYTAYNPKTKEACYVFVIGSATDEVFEQDLLRAFLTKNVEQDLVFSSRDELSDRVYDEGGIHLNRLSSADKEKYIKSVYS